VPEISRFFGIVIKMFFDDHNPPHFHAEYGGDLALIDIRNLSVFSGDNQPFCDGSHKVTALKPIVFKVEQTTTAYLCQCKHSKNKPYCDGTHKTV
jgi:CDGSH-type Zn-finger protein